MISNINSGLLELNIMKTNVRYIVVLYMREINKEY